MRHRGYRSRALVGLAGEVVVRRARYQCARTGRIYFPLDEQLALPAGEVTAPLARRVTHLATHMSFAELQSSVALHYELRLCDSVLNRLLQRVGGVAATDDATRVAEMNAAAVGRDREEKIVRRRVSSAPKRLYVSTDGVLYPSRNREETGGMRRILYQEMKCGAVFWQDDGGRWHKRVLNGREDAETFGLRLWALAVECGLLDAGEVIFISDGGAWCETVWRTHFHDARRILDWYHAAEHVWAAARALYSDEAAGKRWAGRCLELLAEYSGIGLLRYLRRSRAARAGDERCESLVALDELIAYIAARGVHGLLRVPRRRLRHRIGPDGGDLQAGGRPTAQRQRPPMERARRLGDGHAHQLPPQRRLERLLGHQPAPPGRINCNL